jgi:hypothetical protein
MVKYPRPSYVKKRIKNAYGVAKYGYNKYATPGMKKKGALQVASDALAVAYSVKKLLNVEYKWVDRYQSTTIGNSTGVVLEASQVPQGDSANTRDGDSLKAMSLSTRIHLARHGSDSNTLVRCMLVKILGKNNAAGGMDASVANLLQTGTPSYVTSFRNKDNTKDFQVLVDKCVMLTSGHNAACLEIHKDFNNCHIKYSSSDTNGTSCEYGSLWWVFVSNQGTYTPTLNVQTRINFIDN